VSAAELRPLHSFKKQSSGGGLSKNQFLQIDDISNKDRPLASAVSSVDTSETVKICFLGEAAVGKSSFIDSIKSNCEPPVLGKTDSKVSGTNSVNNSDVCTRYFKFPFVQMPIKTRLWD
jgi:GTPase SAR1 family protein